MTDKDKEAMQIADNILNEALEYEKNHNGNHSEYSATIKLSDYKKLLKSNITYSQIKTSVYGDIWLRGIPLKVINDIVDR